MLTIIIMVTKARIELLLNLFYFILVFLTRNFLKAQKLLLTNMVIPTQVPSHYNLAVFIFIITRCPSI
jgi:hypothetical protein